MLRESILLIFTILVIKANAGYSNYDSMIKMKQYIPYKQQQQQDGYQQQAASLSSSLSYGQDSSKAVSSSGYDRPNQNQDLYSQNSRQEMYKQSSNNLLSSYYPSAQPVSYDQSSSDESYKPAYNAVYSKLGSMPAYKQQQPSQSSSYNPSNSADTYSSESYNQQSSSYSQSMPYDSQSYKQISSDSSSSFSNKPSYTQQSYSQKYPSTNNDNSANPKDSSYYSNEKNLCAGQEPGTKLPLPSNTNQFIVCLEDGSHIIMTCPKQLVFHPETGQCENTMKLLGCLSNPCHNGATCIDKPMKSYECKCSPGYMGRLCDQPDACENSSCGPNGYCVPLASGSPIDKFCICDNGLTYGVDCSRTQQNPCLTNDAYLYTYPSSNNPAIFIHCEGNLPHLKFCNYPLVYSHKLQQCDWDATTVAAAPSSPSSYKPTY